MKIARAYPSREKVPPLKGCALRDAAAEELASRKPAKVSSASQHPKKSAPGSLDEPAVAEDLQHTSLAGPEGPTAVERGDAAENAVEASTPHPVAQEPVKAKT
ncbi:MAG TPA: hypothetical protein VET69_11350, partial [Terriglobales bacterium]|nr:hypothetical protein [Terriglobales bacterium]